MNALVIGYGSIGARHARLLQELGCPTAIVSRRKFEHPRHFEKLSDALAQHRPDFVVIANRTQEHFSTLRELAQIGYTGKVLIEKPLADRTIEIPENRFSQAAVAYNLRFHPLIQKLKNHLGKRPAIVAHAYVGQYLPSWRSSDYRESYSSKADQGGGSLRDLSHELDLLLWLLGDWKSVAALGGHFSPLEITSDDAYSLLLSCERCPSVTVHMNYLDRTPKRELSIHTPDETLRVDLIQGRFEVNGKSEELQVERDSTYRELLLALLKNREVSTLCSIAEGLNVVRLIEAAEDANRNRCWVTL